VPRGGRSHKLKAGLTAGSIHILIIMSNKIYKITCTANRMFYIGRTNRPLCYRLKEHLARLESNKHNAKFQNCYNKHGPESFKIELLESASAETISSLEQQYINKYWGNKKFLNCSKSGTGGYTTAGYNKEEMAKLSAAKCGKNNSFYGRVHSEETKEKQAAKKRGDQHWIAKLTWAEVTQMRQDYSLGHISYSALAERYNLTRSAIAHIIQGKKWLDPNYTYKPRK
jgi:group I intron endonuclease